ncbi:metallophosphoesterase [Flavisolibacter nicotianae]|uniref:metallophosphoesterase n=1 Tax=Flavisolibacter nicotianae TaxID=2364882 RepID=UPI000EB07FAD|nr:metallophosphoesterase [Flavisolibacter nicotianae]
MLLWVRQNLFKIVLWASNRFASRPEKNAVFESLSKLHEAIGSNKESKGIVIPFAAATGRFVIFSDQHKGAKNGADDFMLCEPAYLAALDHYFENDFHFVSLGDSEELWENRLSSVLKKQQPSFDRYRRFAAANRLYKTIGNHDLDWKNNPLTMAQVRLIFKTSLCIYDGILLQTEIKGNRLSIFCTHGHQGDKASDGNWFSKFFVSKIWAPLQILLKINPNTPAYDAQLKTLHNRLMYEWSNEQQNLLLITGHTHQPVFESLTHIERLYRQLLLAKAGGDEKTAAETEVEIQKRKFEYSHVSSDYLNMRPSYFNSGCCCNNDGDITGIEIEDGCLRLVKWTSKAGHPHREVLEEETLEVLLQAVAAKPIPEKNNAAESSAM